MKILSRMIKTFAVLLLGFASLCVAALDLPDTIELVRPSVVGVGTARPAKRPGAKGPPVNFLATAFVVGNGRQVITNYHVVDRKLEADQQETLVIFVGRGQRSQMRPAKIVGTDAEHDLALLEIEGAPLPALTLAGPEPAREGQEIAFTGFPIGVVLGLYHVTHRGIISAVTPIVIPANDARSLTPEQIKRIRNPFEVYQLDATAYPGNSGSPVYEVDSGRVIGVINSVFIKETKESVLQKPSGISYAIPSRYVRLLLDARQVAP